jgi:hypothetical protein
MKRENVASVLVIKEIHISESYIFSSCNTAYITTVNTEYESREGLLWCKIFFSNV